MSVVDGFDWDDGNWPKCARHGVTREEIEAALLGEPYVLPDRTGLAGEVRLNAVGRSRDGRHLFIVFTLRQRGGRHLLRPISARYMHAKEIAHYERHQKARRRET
ncbi:BrnT family toxin [Methylobacterium oxalidis]|uniref:BrnT family toxin n=1 Tax=Methylobacterium oxalidis TaxID=944322 RepID=A0A512J9V3_9HYPH|nr:BrnT family toxin [Methylobacterium oxalidis]GEP06728.1 hypothetical protein MOX02_47660 [Methylobacterium oxalidis]GJE33617.1 hypothetical protein LDDCCGHA_3818 [Methylobacterium oxalidis]GLS64731.1 hypothetical protein GCM10007888_31120 [Methylobacterium oxalidis]